MSRIYPCNPRRRRTLAAAVALFAIATTFSAKANAADATWAWIPYRVKIAIAAESHPQMTAALVADVKTKLERRARDEFGAAWRAEIAAEAAGKVRSICTELATSRAAEFKPLLPLAGDFDKLYCVTLAADRAAYRVEIVEYDAAVRNASAVVRRETANRSSVPALAADALSASFRPLAMITDAGPDGAEIELRAHQLMNEALRARCGEPGLGYAPHFRRRDRNGEVVAIDAVPWTLLEVVSSASTSESGEGAGLKCAVRSGVRNPLAKRMSSRTDRPALAVGRPDGATRLVAADAIGGLPLRDLRVYQVAGVDVRLLGRTDSVGALVLPNVGGRVSELLITGRFVPLVRVPLIVGRVDEVVVPVPADERLRAAEDWLSDWQSEFLDLYLRRRLAVRLASACYERQDHAGAAGFLERLATLEQPAVRIAGLEKYHRREAAAGPASPLVDALFIDVLRTARALDDHAAVQELRERLAKESPP